MMRLQFDFKSISSSDSYYDIREDWDLIESSLAKQYGIRIRTEKNMPWTEFCTLVSGLMADTPLGQIVSIRSEKDIGAIKSFSPDQKRIHSEWMNREAKRALENPEKLAREMDAMSQMLDAMFGERKEATT